MTVTDTAVQQGSATAENLDARLDRAEREWQEADAETGGDAQTAEVEASPTTPAAPTPEGPKKGAWRDAVLDDVDDGFFKDKPAVQLYDSFKSSVAAMQKAQREANLAKSENAQLRQAMAEVQKPPEQRQALPNPENDPEIEKINELLWSDTPKAVEMLERRSVERAEKRAREVWQEESAKQSRSDAVNAFRQNTAAANLRAVERAMTEFGWSEQEAWDRVQSTWSHINKYAEDPQYGPAVWLNDENYMRALAYLYPAPAQPSAPAAPAEAPPPEPETEPDVPIADPPGSRRPVAVTPRPAQPSGLSREAEKERRDLAKQLGLDPEEVVKAARRRIGG